MRATLDVEIAFADVTEKSTENFGKRHRKCVEKPAKDIN